MYAYLYVYVQHMKLRQPTLLALRAECKARKREQYPRPIIDAPGALITEKDKGNKLICCRRTPLDAQAYQVWYTCTRPHKVHSFVLCYMTFVCACRIFCFC